MRKRFLRVAWICAFMVFGTPWAAAQSRVSFECPKNQRIRPGVNSAWVTHKKVARKFYAEFPDVPEGTPVGVIFSWHGVGGTLEKWRESFPLADYSSRQFPFIVITPEDTDLKPIGRRRGLGWDFFKSIEGDNNLEAKLFESVLGTSVAFKKFANMPSLEAERSDLGLLLRESQSAHRVVEF